MYDTNKNNETIVKEKDDSFLKKIEKKRWRKWRKKLYHHDHHHNDKDKDKYCGKNVVICRKKQEKKNYDNVDSMDK